MRLVYKLLFWGLLLGASATSQAALNEEQLSRYVAPPMELGTKDNVLPVWQVLNSGGALAGYIFETRELTPIPGFSGTPMNLLVTIDTNGSFIDVNVLDQNEPVFVSGLGARPFHEFVSQYRGHSLASNIKVLPASAEKPSDSESGANTYIDGVTKATASVRIANETILASALKVAREKLANIAPKAARRPRQALFEPMQWQQLVDAGLIKNLHLNNRDLERAFYGTQFSTDDMEARQNPDALYLDLWIADLGVPSVARNILLPETLNTLQGQLADNEEPLLILANGRHQLVAQDFVRNSVPDHMGIMQQGFPISLRDADAEMAFLPTIPEFDQKMIIRVDTRYGFDPSSPWDFIIKALRKHGSFRPEIGSQDFKLTHKLDERYFEDLQENTQNFPYWLLPWVEKKVAISLLLLFLGLLSYYLYNHRQTITGPQRLAPVRFSLLIVTLIYVGWLEQGQLSIVTLLGFIRAIFQTHNFSFLLYDPISLVLWLYVLASLFIWGRGTFCGWLCPFGALQEFAHQLGQKLGIKEINLPHSTTQKLGLVKYAVLSVLVGSVFISPALSDKLVEVEPFKTAITLTFERAWPYVLYALICLLASMVIFKGYCRFLCPLGAALALGGKLRLWDWLVRRDECGTPCKLCSVTCRYDAIERQSGTIKYDDCFQCLECIEIYDDENRCVPLVQESKRREKVTFNQSLR
jgi:NosR/NirI family nitrous oxide reductase transcriptional regulator